MSSSLQEPAVLGANSSQIEEIKQEDSSLEEGSQYPSHENKKTP
jgi:hypothetical protein